VSERTFTAVARRVEATPLDEIALEGLQRPVRIFQITKAKSEAATTLPRIL
jgi:class 3 adenylate cyclase